MTASIIRSVYLPQHVMRGRVRRADGGILFEPSLGTALMYGRNSEGEIRVYARNLVTQRFIQVGLFDRFELADLYVKQLREDDSFRRGEVRTAKELAPFKP